jgi:hypothetical protein
VYRTTPRPDPCYSTPYPAACYDRSISDETLCRCKGGELSPEGCTAQAGQARDFDCGDPVTSSGLHNYIIQMTERTRALGLDSDDSLNEQNQNYRFIADNYIDEWRQGLLASTLLYQHEAVDGMRANTIISEGCFGFVLFTILIQYVFLSTRYANLHRRLGAVLAIVSRFRKLDANEAVTGRNGPQALR